jgi:putative inorganic carbon (hco3(-)) transporter
MSMERLTFGYGVPRRHVDAPEVRSRVEPPAEDQVHAVLADPLPGESSDWAYFGLLAFTAVLFFRPQDQFPFLEPVHLAELSAVVGLTAMAAKRLVRRLPLVHATAELWGLVAFGTVLVATTPFSFWPGGSVEVITGLYLKVLLIVVLMMNSLNTPTRLQQFTWLVVVASSYISTRAVVDYLRGVNLVEGGRVAGAVQGIFGNPNDLALNMVVFLPFAALYGLLATHRRTARRAKRVGSIASRAPSAAVGQRLFGAAAVFAMLMAIVFTKSRGGFLGLASMVLVLVHYGRRLKPGLAVAVVVLLVAMVPLLPTSFWARMSSITDPSEDVTGSRAARREVMLEAAQVFVERPLTGIGAGQFKNYNPPGKVERWREAHDVWLQVASETGIFGLLVFGYLVVAAFRAALWSRRRLAEFGRTTRRRPSTVPAGRSAPAPGQADDDTAPTDGSAPSTSPLVDSTDLRVLRLHASALVPSLVGWFVCAFFASVAYNWTFYYLLGLCVVTRDLTRAALAVRAVDGRAAQAADLRHRRGQMPAAIPAS